MEGRGPLVALPGEAGIGKTALVRKAVASAPGSGLAVASAEASPMVAHRPFGPWRDALGLAEVPALAPFQVVDALIEEIERRRAHAPQWIVLGDLHFADPACLDVLGGWPARWGLCRSPWSARSGPARASRNSNGG